MMKRAFVIAVGVLGAFCSVVSAKGGAPEAALRGRWEVDRVLPNLTDQMHWEMRPDNPMLMYRELVIGDEVRFGDGQPCKQTRWSALSTSWGALFRKSFSRAEGPTPASHPKPSDFGLSLCGSGRIKAYLLCSARPEKVARPWLDGEWIALKDPDTLLFHYSAGVILSLKRVPNDAPPRASFPCEKASSPSEKAICKSRDLAGWDRSVAEGLRQQLAFRSDERAELLKAHESWRRERDKCGAEASCLGEALRARTAELAQ